MMGNPITKLESQNKEYDIGATFDNVFLGEDDNFSLKDLYNYLDDYFNQDMFMIYSEEAPAADNVKVWYDTTVEQIV